MKKTVYILVPIGITLLILVSFWVFPSKLKHEIIINSIPEDTPIALNLYYADINMLDIDAYNFNGNTFKKIHKPYTSYTEGFIPRSESLTYLELINNYRKLQKLPPKNYFHDFYEDENRIIISFTGSLSDIYIIDKIAKTVSPLTYNAEDNLGDMYVSHIKPYGDTLIILAGKANAYTSFIYQVSLDTYSTLSSISLPTSPDAIQDIHYGITQSGKCIFINGSKLKIYDVDTASYHFMQLPFYATAIKVVGDKTLVLSLEDTKLQYVLLNSALELTHSNTLESPVPAFKLVDFGLINNYIYLVTYDPSNTLYPNYITLYTAEGEMVYSTRIGGYKDKALLEVTPE